MTLDETTDFLETLDNTDAAMVYAAIVGLVSPVDARRVLNSNASSRAFYLDQAFQMAHAAAHAEKVERETKAARAARKAA